MPQTLHEWVKREEVDAGQREGLTTSERERLKQLERENKELRRANEILKTFLIGQSKHDDTPFDVADASVKEHLTGDWQDKVRGRISRADVVCVLWGTRTHTAKGVAIEYSIAKQLGKPLFLLKGYKDADCTRPMGAENEKIYNWTWENLKTLIHGGR